MTDALPNLYAVLGVPRDSTPAEVRAAFRSLVRRFHPDTRAPGTRTENVAADASLRQVVTAYETLRDPGRRSDYDKLTAPKPAPMRSRLHPARVSQRRAANDSPIRAGPVHWTPPR